jgi:dimethylargininase
VPRVFDFNSAIVRLPSRSVVAGLRAHAGPAPEADIIRAEHAAYVAALRDAGLRVTTLEPLEDFPDAMFVEDPALVFAGAALLLRPGAPSRFAEARELAATLRARFPMVRELNAGFADGGDILVTPAQICIGLSSRTDRAGASALRDLLESMGRRCRAVEIPAGTLHLKSECSLVDEETILATEAIAAHDVFKGMRVLVVPRQERRAANALRVNDRMLVNADGPRTCDLLARHGVNVVPLRSTEIAKLDAGLSCMSLRWYDAAVE